MPDHVSETPIAVGYGNNENQVGNRIIFSSFSVKEPGYRGAIIPDGF
jgi:hypothetical protein